MKLFRLLALLLASASLVSACGGNDDDADDRLDIADPKVRFVHAIPAGPNVSLYRNDVKQADATNVGYKFASKYFDVDNGAADWKVKLETGDVTLSTTNFDAHHGNKYTLIALPGQTAADALLIDDPYNKGLVSDKARVRVVNASFNAQNVDIYLTQPQVDINTVGPTMSAVGFKTASPASGNDSVELEGGVYQLRVTTAGTKTVIFNVASVNLEDNADWLLLTIPSEGIGAVTPNDIRVLVAKSDDSAQTTLELVSQ